MTIFGKTGLLALAAVLALAPAAQGGRRALVIAVEEYKVERFNNIHGCVNDAEAVMTILRRDLGFAENEIRYLKNSAATRAGILSAMDDWLIRGTRPGDAVFLYYAGHGYYTPDDNGDEKDEKPANDETLCPYDTDPDLMTDPKRKGNMVLDDDIREKLARLSGRRIVAAFDSCHSGTAVRGNLGEPAPAVRTLPVAAGVRGLSGVRKKQSAGPVYSMREEIADSESFMLFISAAAPHEKAQELMADNGQQHGAFTYSLIQAFAEKGRETTAADIQAAFEDLRGRASLAEQNPQVEGNPALAKTGWYEIFNAAGGETFVQAAESQPPGIDLSLWATSRGQRRSAFSVGDPVRLHFRANRNGYLYLFDHMEATGEMFLLFPNRWSRMTAPGGGGNAVRAGAELRVPPDSAGGVPITFEFTANRPGRERIIAVFSRDPWPEMEAAVGVNDAEAKSLNESQKEQILTILSRKQSERDLEYVSGGAAGGGGDWAGTHLTISIQ